MNENSKRHFVARIYVFLGNCICALVKMSVVPYGAFAARKVRQNEKLKNDLEINVMPTKYSSKYMNSVWGMYNRYSVHNLKKNFDDQMFAFPGPDKQSAGPQQSVAEKNATDLKTSLSKFILPFANIS